MSGATIRVRGVKSKPIELDNKKIEKVTGNTQCSKIDKNHKVGLHQLVRPKINKNEIKKPIHHLYFKVQ